MPLELFLNATSPYARIVRVCALEKGLEDRLILNWVDPWADDAELIEVNPNAKVPALCCEDRTSITETLPILYYLDSLTERPILLPRESLAAVLHGVGLGMGEIGLGQAEVAMIIGDIAQHVAGDALALDTQAHHDIRIIQPSRDIGGGGDAKRGGVIG